MAQGICTGGDQAEVRYSRHPEGPFSPVTSYNMTKFTAVANSYAGQYHQSTVVVKNTSGIIYVSLLASFFDDRSPDRQIRMLMMTDAIQVNTTS